MSTQFQFNPFTGKLDIVGVTDYAQLDGGCADTVYGGVDVSPIDGGAADTVY